MNFEDLIYLVVAVIVVAASGVSKWAKGRPGRMAEFLEGLDSDTLESGDVLSGPSRTEAAYRRSRPRSRASRPPPLQAEAPAPGDESGEEVLERGALAGRRGASEERLERAPAHRPARAEQRLEAYRAKRRPAAAEQRLGQGGRPATRRRIRPVRDEKAAIRRPHSILPVAELTSMELRKAFMFSELLQQPVSLRAKDGARSV